jgi:hypothetical protein
VTAPPDDEEQVCVFNTAECGEPVFFDDSGEPWCQHCMDAYRADQIQGGYNDPERPLQ